MDDGSMDDAARILAAARLWIGTPYRHQASLRGVGCDCLGLIRGVWRHFFGVEPERAPPYSASWAEDGAGEIMLAAARRHLLEIELAEARPGDVLLFRMRDQGPAKHAALLAEGDAILHAMEGHAVLETPIPPGWARRRAAAFRFPPLPPEAS